MRNRFYATVIYFFFAVVIYAQSFEFSRIENTNGLSNNQILSIFKDSQGFMWFGTNSGLNRYDGYRFKIYKHDKHDTSSISSDHVTEIHEDTERNLWLHLNNGEYDIFNLNTETFQHDVNAFLKRKLLPEHPDLLFIADNKDFYVYKKQTGIYWNCSSNGKTIHIKPSVYTKKEAKNETIVSIDASPSSIWILFNNGFIERINKKTLLSDYQNNYFSGLGVNTTINKHIQIDRDGDVWMLPSFDDHGIAFLNMKTRQWNFMDNKTNESLNKNLVRFVLQDKNGLFWIGTDHGGVYLFNKQTGRQEILQHDVFNENSISQNSATVGFADDQGTVWIGTYKRGICYYHPDLLTFSKPELYAGSRKNSDIVDCNSLFKDGNSNLWIGTNGSGLLCYNEKTKALKSYTENTANSISSNIITSITQDHSSVIWIGTFMGGLNSFDGTTFKHYPVLESSNNSLSSKSVYSIIEDKNQNLWIGTLGGGLIRLSADRKQFTQYTTTNNRNIISNYILSMRLGRSSDLLLATDRGVCWLDVNSPNSFRLKGKIDRQKIAGETCNNILMDSRNLVWIATDRGITIFNSISKEYQYITQKEGLPDDEIVSLTEDNHHQIWAGTKRGVVRIQYLRKNQVEITTFDTKDGLPSSTCNVNAIFKDKQGIIYLGTINGYVFFNPSNIRTNTAPPALKLTELRLNNNEVRPLVEYEGNTILTTSISDVNKLTLNYDQTNITLRFSSLNYLHPEKCNFRYKLEGLDKDYIFLKNGSSEISYSNLTPGNYTLFIYASNSDGIWSKKPLKLDLVVNPPFWNTWWADTFYVLLGAFMVWLFIRYKLKKQTQEFEQAHEILNAKKMHEVDELKFRFFTNISHEFKTPITLILAPVEKLLKENQEEKSKELLKIVKKNAFSLLDMVNEILEFRKLDLNILTLKLTRGDIIEFIRQISYTFSPLAKQKEIDFLFSSSVHELLMSFDKEKMHRIITNLLSNAFKYTEKGEIRISIRVSENLTQETQNLIIEISDTGIGIAEKDKEKIFDRFYTVENGRESKDVGTGVGLHLVHEYVNLHHGTIEVLSEPRKGSSFILKFPIAESKSEEFRRDTSSEHIHLSNSDEAIEKTASSPTNQNNKPPLLLIVDDNKDFLQFMKTLLEDNYRLLFANDGEMGLSMALKQSPDVIVSDVMMPQMDGYEFCRRLKSNKETSSIPLILVTAKTSDENKYIGLEAGADDYISKPFSIDLLLLKISRLVDTRRKRLEEQKHTINLSSPDIELTSDRERFIKKVVGIIEENIGNTEFSVESLCKQMAMSRVGFYKQILSVTGKTPSEFIRQIRLKRASLLLEKTNLYVNEIALQVGFNEPKYFRKYFKEEFGMTPNEYKKQHGHPS